MNLFVISHTFYEEPCSFRNPTSGDGHLSLLSDVISHRLSIWRETFSWQPLDTAVRRELNDRRWVNDCWCLSALSATISTLSAFPINDITSMGSIIVMHTTTALAVETAGKWSPYRRTPTGSCIQKRYFIIHGWSSHFTTASFL